MPVLSISTASHFVAVALLDQDQVRLELDSRNDYEAPDNQITGVAAGELDHLPPGFTRKPRKGSSLSGSPPARRVFPPGASVMLAPLIETLLTRTQCEVSDLDLIAVTTGPGLFTGLRVGVVTAKALAYAAQVDIVAVHTLEALALQAAQELPEAAEPPVEIHVVSNAQRKQLFCGRYLVDSQQTVRPLQEDQILDWTNWMAQLPDRGLVTGPGLKPIEQEIRGRHPGMTITSPSSWDLKAGSVGQLAWYRWQAGHRDDLWQVNPVYFRPSAAEEVRSARQSEN